MRARPGRLTALSVFLLAVAAGFPLQIMILYGHGPLEVTAIAGKLAPLNWLALALSLVTAWLILRASSWLLFALPALGALVTYNNWFVARVGTDYPVWAAALGSALFLAALGAAWNRETFKLVLEPRLRWWLTPVRFAKTVPIRVRVFGEPGQNARRRDRNGGEFYTRTFDISESGAFIPFEALPVTRPAHRAGELTVGSQCFVCLTLKDLFYVQCRAEVVRAAPASGKYPAGIGLKFLGMSREDRRRLQEFMLRNAYSPSAT